MRINAKITGISYSPLLCGVLNHYSEHDFENALNADACFLYTIQGKTIAVSKWVSPKRTRSYPGARVYNTLNHSGKKITIIPFVKDEGSDGDRDFIQWDTISLMSLLGVYVIVAYYSSAVKNISYTNKITAQKFDTQYILAEIEKLLSYQSDALHWNIEQIGNIIAPAHLANRHYARIQSETGVTMHPLSGIDKRIAVILKGRNEFMNLSRNLAKTAQIRETQTIQPKEKITSGIKARITITNYLGGAYYLTCDEAEIIGNTITIIEAKHTKNGGIPSLDDIKEGCIKMMLFTNLKNVSVDGIELHPVPILKLTAGNTAPDNAVLKDVFRKDTFRKKTFLEEVIKEAKANHFTVILPDGSKR